MRKELREALNPVIETFISGIIKEYDVVAEKQGILDKEIGKTVDERKLVRAEKADNERLLENGKLQNKKREAELEKIKSQVQASLADYNKKSKEYDKKLADADNQLKDAKAERQLAKESLERAKVKEKSYQDKIDLLGEDQGKLNKIKKIISPVMMQIIVQTRTFKGACDFSFTNRNTGT